MKIVRLPADKFVITEEKTLKDALVVITNNYRGVVMVINKESRLLGVVSDGDIRRAMIQGATEHTPVGKFVNTNSKFSKEDASDSDILTIFKNNRGVHVLPLVDEDNKVTNIAYLELFED